MNGHLRELLQFLSEIALLLIFARSTMSIEKMQVTEKFSQLPPRSNLGEV